MTEPQGDDCGHRMSADAWSCPSGAVDSFLCTRVRYEAREDRGFDFYPSARDGRGPLRLYGLDPDT